jgi:oxygen-independent coproporphyrinogen-3 oxidase
MMPTEGGIITAPSSGLAALAAEVAGTVPPLPVSLYVHVPFCLSKCGYCDFYSVPGAPSLHARFVDAALFEAGHWSHYDLLDDVPSLYVGGGTPTAMGPQLVRLIDGLQETARIRAGAEITVETNPETTDQQLVNALIDAGVNRFSIGVQSFDDDVLRILGRCHDAARTESALATLRATGIPFSIDLMCGVPGQSFESWESTLEAAVSCGARHVSVYPLSVEEGTPLAARIADGELAQVDPDAAADMMLAAEVVLAAAGMPRYEVANYAQPGHEAQHNLVYWTGGAYLGVGPHAASMLPASAFEQVAAGEGWEVPVGAEGPAERIRFTRETSLDEYLRKPLARPEPIEALSVREAAREDVMLGLRLSRGVPVTAAQAAGSAPALRQLEEQGLVARSVDDAGFERWATTQRGWLLGNAVFGAVWSGQ